MHQALDKCLLGDEVRKKEGKLDSAGMFLDVLVKVSMKRSSSNFHL